MREVAIFFTAGISDIKFLGADGRLLELTKHRGVQHEFLSIRAIHEALLAQGSDRLALMPFEGTIESDGNRAVHISFLADPVGKDIFQSGAVASDLTSIPLKFLEDGRLVLVADKFDAAWRAIQSEDVNVNAIIGFRTLRDDDPQEPIASEMLIHAAMTDKLHPRHHRLVEYVKGCERLEDVDIVGRIERAVRECRTEVGSDVEPWLAISGGVPGAKEVLRAAVELHLGPARSILRREDADANYIRAPHDSLIARRHALDFVRRGALIEAAAVAFPFRDDRRELQQWVRPLHLAARLLDGNPVDAYAKGLFSRTSNSWLKVEPPDFLQTLAKQIMPGEGQSQRRCLLVGLRAEAALRNCKWVDAINLTVTFVDAARRDSIERHLKGVFTDAGKFTLGRSLSVAEDDVLCRSRYGPAPGRPCLMRQADLKYTVASTREHNDVWYKFLGGALEEMNLILNKGEPSLREIRNRNTHDILDEGSLEAGRERFVKSGLWKESEQGNQMSLLSAKIPEAVLEQVGYFGRNPLDQILKALEACLLDG